MQVKLIKQSGAVTAKISGELDHHTAHEIKQKLDEAIKQTDKLILDFAQLKFMDSAGIGVILSRYNRIKAKNGVMYVKNVNAQVNKLCELSGIYQVIKKI